jgi:hypothetical protein
VLAGASVLAAAGGTRVAITPWAFLLAAGLALELGETTKPPSRPARLMRAALWALVIWSGLGVLEAMLRGEVVYTALGVVVLALVVASGRESDEPAASPAR